MEHLLAPVILHGGAARTSQVSEYVVELTKWCIAPSQKVVGPFTTMLILEDDESGVSFRSKLGNSFSISHAYVCHNGEKVGSTERTDGDLLELVAMGQDQFNYRKLAKTGPPPASILNLSKLRRFSPEVYRDEDDYWIVANMDRTKVKRVRLMRSDGGSLYTISEVLGSDGVTYVPIACIVIPFEGNYKDMRVGGIDANEKIDIFLEPEGVSRLLATFRGIETAPMARALKEMLHKRRLMGGLATDDEIRVIQHQSSLCTCEDCSKQA